MAGRKSLPQVHGRLFLEELEERNAAGNLLPYLSSLMDPAPPSQHLYSSVREYSTSIDYADYSLVNAEEATEAGDVLQSDGAAAMDNVFIAVAGQDDSRSETSLLLVRTNDPFAQEETQEQHPVSQDETDPMATRLSNNAVHSAEHVQSNPPSNNVPPNMAGAYAGASQGPGGVSTPNPSGGGSGGGGGSANLQLPSQTQLQQMLSGALPQTGAAAPVAPSNVALNTTSPDLRPLGNGTSEHASRQPSSKHPRIGPLDGGGLNWVTGSNSPDFPPIWNGDYDTVSLNQPTNQINTDGDSVSLEIQASDNEASNDISPDSDGLNFAAINLPLGLSINSSTGLISGTIPYGDAAKFDGAYNPTIVVTDNDGGTASTSFSWTINPAQAAPVLPDPGTQTNLRGDTVSLQVNATQTDNNPLTYSASNLPIGLSIDSETGLISGTVDPSATLEVPYAVTVTATDDTTNLSANQSFNWTINPTNVAPVLTSVGNQTNSAGDDVSLQLSAADADGDNLTYTATGLPPGLSLDPTSGVISGTLPNNAASNTPHSVTVAASDGMASSSQSFSWTVNAVGLQNPGDQDNLDGNSVSLQLAASDANNATLTYSASGLPSGLSINSSTGLITGTISATADANSPYSVTVTATDTNNDRVSQTFNWTVARVALNTVTDQENQEDTAVSLQLSARDNEGTPTFSATGLPPGLSISGTGLISGTIGISSFGKSPYQVTVTATDGSATSSQSFIWTVTPRVALVNPGDQSNAESDTVTLQLSATSPGGTMSYSASGLPPGLSINSSTGLISGTISSGDSTNSPYTVTVTANDGTSSSSQTFSWTVAVINLVSPGDQNNNDGDTVSLALTTGYNGGGWLSYSATGLPPGLSMNSSTGQITGTISGTADTNSPYSVSVTVTDGTNTSSQTFDWAVNAVVSIGSIDDRSNAAGDAVSLQVTASDSLNNTLTYSATSLPTGLSINSTTGLISGTIAVGADGSSPYSVMVTATDSAGNSASQSFNWTVSHVALVNPGSQWSVDGQAVSLPLQGGDADGGTVTYTASGLPSGLSINTSTGLISGTIASNADTNSPYNVTVTASDGTNTKTQTFLWTVSQVELTLPSAQTNTEGDTVSLQLQGTTSSGSLSYNAGALPDGLSLNTSSGLISGTIAPGAAANGPFTVDVSASNGTDSTSQSFTWTVNPVVNLTAPADQSNNVGNNVSLQVSATDTLNQTLTYSAIGLPTGLSINSSTGLISGTITSGDPNGGPFAATVTATDGTYSTSAAFNWYVTDTAALTMTVPGTQVNVASDSVVNVQVQSGDADGDAVSFSATNLPDGLSIDPNTGLISGVIAEDAADPAPYPTTVTASDGNGQSVSQTFTWIVNAPPINAQAVPLNNLIEGVDPGVFTLATFTTPDNNSLPDDFAAIINYGDGTTDSGAISGGDGSFTVTADHVYAETGSYTITIEIFNGLTGASTIASTSATVYDGALTLTGTWEGDPGGLIDGFVVGILTDQNPGATTADFTETIDTGEGMILSGQNYLQQIGPGRFLVIDPVGYPGPGSPPNTSMQIYPVSVTVTDVDGKSVSTNSQVVEGLLPAQTPETMTGWFFEDQNSNATGGEFTINIAWGDGTSSAGQAVYYTGGNGTPTIWYIAPATHTYAQDSYDQPNGRYQITITITSPDGDLTGIQYVSVDRPPLNQYTANVNISTNLNVSNAPIAVFTVADPLDTVSEFSAQIDWGDGTISAGTIEQLASGMFEVLGSHGYAAYDWYTISVMVSQGWGGMVAADEGAGLAGGTPIIEFRPRGKSAETKSGLANVDKLNVGTWETAFVGQGRNMRLRKGDFVLADPQHFTVWVDDPMANKIAGQADTIQVYLASSSDTGHDITLAETGATTGLFVSKSLLLTTFAIDQQEAGDRALHDRLGDEVTASYIVNGDVKAEAAATVPVKAEVHLNINILRVTPGGAPVTTKATVKNDYHNANRIYAAAGIRLAIDKIQYVDPPPTLKNYKYNYIDKNGIKRQTTFNYLANGLLSRFIKGFNWDSKGQLFVTDPEKYLLEDQKLRTKNDINVYYVNYLAQEDGTDFPAHKGYGESFPLSLLAVNKQRYAGSVIMSANKLNVDDLYQGLAHEIGHILLDSGEHDRLRVVNLMADPPQSEGKVTDSRRIPASKAKVMLNNIKKLFSNP